MAGETQSRFPSMGLAQWLRLRKEFNRSMPKSVTLNYLATVLDMAETSAKNNIMPSLRLTGIVDKDGKTTELANAW